MFEKEISKEDVNKLDLHRYEGKIVLIDQPEQIAEAAAAINRESLVGIDTETRPAFRKGQVNKVALLQIATSDCVYAIRLKKAGFPDSLKEIFASKAIKKIGIAVNDDLKDLKELNPFEEQAVIDLNTYFKERDFKSFGARKLTALILGFRISKSKQTSNWDAKELSQAQLRYAATDAWVCREIYLKVAGQQ